MAADRPCARQSVSPDGQASFTQDIGKLQLGIDGEADGLASGHLLLGAFAGLGRSEQDFSDSTSEATATTIMAGLYGSYLNGGFYTDAVLKFEHQDSAFSGVSTDEEASPFDVNLFGTSLETGYRFTAATSFYLQPRARLTFAHAAAGSFEDTSDVTIDLVDSDSLRGEAGGRIGAELHFGAVIAELHLDAALRHEFLGRQQVVDSDQTFTHELPGTAAAVSTGVDLAVPEQQAAFTLVTGYAKSDDGEELTATGGFRLWW